MRKIFNAAFGSVDSGVLLVNKKRVIQQANQAICSLLGYTEEALINLSLDDLVWQESYEEEGLAKSFSFTESEDSIELEKRLIRKDTSLVWVHFCLHTGYDQHTHAWYGLVMLTDISERKELEAKLKSLMHQQECVLQQIHQQIKCNQALLHFADSLPYNHQKKQYTDSMLAEFFAGRAKSAPWVYSSLYVREKTSGIDLQKHIHRIVKQAMLAYPTNGYAQQMNLQIEPLYLNAGMANGMAFIIKELLAVSLPLQADAAIYLSVRTCTGINHIQLAWQSKPGENISMQDICLSVEMISTLAASFQGTVSVTKLPDEYLSIAINFQNADKNRESTDKKYIKYPVANWQAEASSQP